MQEKELKYYETIKNWEFSQIKMKEENITNWNFYKKIQQNTDENSLCLDLGTGGGEKTLKNYPNVAMLIGTDFSKEMIKTANENLKKYPNKRARFTVMDNLNMTFPSELFDLISARHTVINAKQIYNCLKNNGTLVIEGVDKEDCIELKDIFKRGQAYNTEKAISQKDYEDLKNAGFSKIEKTKILVNEYYETKEDLLALLLKTPIINDFEDNENKFIENDLLENYITKYQTGKGILLKRVLYGIVAKK